MGIFRALKSLVSPTTMGEEVIEAQYKTYRAGVARNPTAEPHELLTQTLLARWAARGVNVSTQDAQTKAFSETLLFACLPPPSCVKALGLYILYKEQPSVIELCPQFGVEYEMLMRPIHQAKETGNLLNLYAKINPILAAQIPSENASDEEEIPEAVDDIQNSELQRLIRQVSDTLSAFIQKNGVRAFMDPSLALCIAKPNRVFLSPLPAAQVPFKDSLVARMLLTDAPARDKLIQLIGDGKSPAIVDLACSEFAKWIVAKATIGAA
ncbi:MAG TPA: hypothetical protein PKJ84_15180 [Anaerolineales bacterium]|nr:hypothetical protein [Anaerolineales bacterium]